MIILIKDIRRNELQKTPERKLFDGPEMLDIDRSGSICVGIKGDLWDIEFEEDTRVRITAVYACHSKSLQFLSGFPIEVSVETVVE